MALNLAVLYCIRKVAGILVLVFNVQEMVPAFLHLILCELWLLLYAVYYVEPLHPAPNFCKFFFPNNWCLILLNAFFISIVLSLRYWNHGMNLQGSPRPIYILWKICVWDEFVSDAIWCCDSPFGGTFYYWFDFVNIFLFTFSMSSFFNFKMLCTSTELSVSSRFSDLCHLTTELSLRILCISVVAIAIFLFLILILWSFLSNFLFGQD